jgi:hypothetical protein
MKTTWKNMAPICGAAVLTLCTAIPALANDFLADSNQFGYTGTVWNISQNSAPSWVAAPRDASLYFAQNVPNSALAPDSGGVPNGNDMESNWYQHPGSNTSADFFQINDGGTVTASNAVWTQVGGSWTFICTVTGANATYANSSARLWEPDTGVAPGGTFTNYTYTLTATGMSTTVVDGWRYNTSAPTGILGSFDATFLSTGATDSNPGGTPGGDTYGVNLAFNKTFWDGTGWSDTYTDQSGTYTYGNYSEFGTAVVPVPLPASAGVGFSMLAGFGVLWMARKRLSQNTRIA